MEKHICVDVIEIILALVYLMTAKCYVLFILSVGTVTKVFYLSQAFPLLESNYLLAANERGY